MASKETKENIKASRYYDNHSWYSLIRKSQTKDNYRKKIRTLDIYMFNSILKNKNT